MPATLEVLERVSATARSAGHHDVAARLDAVRRRTVGDLVRVVLVGAPGEGTSSLVNAVVGAPVCPVGPDGGTTVPWVVRGGPTVHAVLVRDQDGADGARRQVPLRALPELVPDATGVEVDLPRRVLDGLELVDTPGVGGPGDPDGEVARRAVLGADVVWVVVDAGAPVEPAVRDVVRVAAGEGLPVHLVRSRVDLHPSWAADPPVDLPGVCAVFGVCARLADEAARRGAPELLGESGLPTLVAAVPRRSRTGSARADLVAAVAELRARSDAARAAEPDPVAGTGTLEAARERGERLRRRTARWQQLLGDGATDLVADVEHDLRERLRGITRDAEAALDAYDPGAMWDVVDGWLAERVAEAVTDNSRWAGERVDWLAGQVWGRVAEDVRDVDEVLVGEPSAPRLGSPDRLLDGLAAVAAVDPGRLTAAQKVLVGMRGSYSGVLMIGLLTGLAGLPLVNPVSVGAGLLIGGKAYRDDAAHRLARRRAEAKVAVRRHLDEVGFQAGKHLRDQLRAVQRSLRDAVAEHVDALQRAVARELQVAQETARRQLVDREAAERAQRRHLELLGALDRAVAALPATSGPTGVVRGVA